MALAWLAWPAAAAAQIAFGSRADLATGAAPSGVALGDLNGDGLLDLVSVDSGDNAVSVFLATGSGTFASRVSYAAGAVPHAVAVADVDRDGRPDVVVADTGADTVSILLGAGDGTLRSRTAFPTGAGPFYVAIADLNADEAPDLVVTNVTADTISVLLGTGDGRFGPKTDLAAGPVVRSAVVGDVNGDGVPDLVIANASGHTIAVRLGLGAGQFGPIVDFSTGKDPRFATLADFNGDGVLDVAAANVTDSTITVMFGLGNGRFGSQTDMATGASPRHIQAADVNLDGYVDLITANFNGPSVSILPGRGDGTFGARIDVTTGAGPFYLKVGDLNRDGPPDIVVVNASATSLSVLTNTTPVAAPAITTQPANRAVNAGRTATFAATASGTPPPSYRWQVSTDQGSSWSNLSDGAPYSGAAQATLTIDSVPSALDGNRYRLVATNRLGSATSDGALLGVNRVTSPVMALDAPADGASVFNDGFTVAGWAIDRGAALGTGIDAVHVWAFPLTGTSVGAGIFLGAAGLGGSRSDVGAVYGAQFSASGFSLAAANLPAGRYRLTAYAESALAEAFSLARSVDITVTARVPDPVMALDEPRSGTIGPSLLVSGWAIDRGAGSGTGVDAVHVYAFPRVGSGFGAGVFLGAAAYGGARADVGALFGGRFTHSAFALTASLTAGAYRVAAYAHSAVAGSFNQFQVSDVTVETETMAIDTPAGDASPSQPFVVSGWAIDRAATGGAGVDAVHVWVVAAGGGETRFGGAATLGLSRSDVAAAFGAQFANAGYALTVNGLPRGQYDLVVYARSTVTAAFSQQRTVRVTVQ